MAKKAMKKHVLCGIVFWIRGSIWLQLFVFMFFLPMYLVFWLWKFQSRKMFVRFFCRQTKKWNKHLRGLNKVESVEDWEIMKVYNTTLFERLRMKEKYIKSILKVRHERKFYWNKNIIGIKNSEKNLAKKNKQTDRQLQNDILVWFYLINFSCVLLLLFDFIFLSSICLVAVCLGRNFMTLCSIVILPSLQSFGRDQPETHSLAIALYTHI